MLKYEKMREYMYVKLGCKFFDLFEQDGTLKYVRFQTQKGINCLVSISRPMTYPSNHSKLIQLTNYDADKEEETFDYFITNNLSLVKKISSNTTPQGYTKFLTRLNPSLESTIYSAAVITPEYLIIDDAHIYCVKDVDLPQSHAQLLIVMDLEVIVERNITNESYRIYNHVLDILNDSTEKFKNHLKTILTKCGEMKILSDKVPKLSTVALVDKNIYLSETTNALSLAVDALEKLN